MAPSQRKGQAAVRRRCSRISATRKGLNGTKCAAVRQVPSAIRCRTWMSRNPSSGDLTPTLLGLRLVSWVWRRFYAVFVSFEAIPVRGFKLTEDTLSWRTGHSPHESCREARTPNRWRPHPGTHFPSPPRPPATSASNHHPAPTPRPRQTPPGIRLDTLDPF